MNGSPSKKKFLGVLLLATVVPISVILGVNLWLSSQGCSHTFCPNLDIIFVRSVTLDSNGWVTFNMTGAYAYDNTIKTVTVLKEPWPGYQPAPPPLGSVSLTSNNFLPAQATLILSVQFQGVTWQPSENYTFAITTYEGLGMEVQGCLNGCWKP